MAISSKRSKVLEIFKSQDRKSKRRELFKKELE